MPNIMTVEQMQKGSLNLDALEAWVEGAPNTTITTPNGRVVPTMSTAVADLTTDGIVQDNKTQRQINAEMTTSINSVSGGYFKAFDTLANLQAATGMTTGQVAKVMSDTAANNGDYRYTGSAWVKGYDVLTDAKAYTDVFANKTAVIVAQFDSAVTIDTVAKTLAVATSGLSIKVGNTSFNVAAQTVNLPSSVGSYVIVYDRQSTVISFKDVYSVATTDYVIGFVLYQSSNYYFNFRFVYKLDGFLVKTNNNKLGVVTVSDNTKISIDTVNNKLNINSARLIAQNVNVVLPTVSIDLPAAAGIYNVDYDTRLKTVSIVSGTIDKSDTTITFARLMRYSNFAELYGVDLYNINNLAPVGAVSGTIFNTSSASVNIDTVNLLLKTTNAARLIYNDGTTLLPTANVALPTTDRVYRVELNLITNTVQIVASSVTQSRMTVRFAKLVIDSTKAVKYQLQGVDLYAIDGATQQTASIATGTLVATVASDLNFNFATNQVVIADYKVRLLSDKNTDILPTTTVDISADNTFWNQLVYNTATKTFSRKRTSVALTGSEIRVALYHPQFKQVYGVPYYSINGQTGGSNKTDLTTAVFNVPYGIVDADYVQPTLPAYDALETADNGDYTKLIARYDALQAAYPDYITKTDLGAAASGTRLYQYQFCAKEVEWVNDGSKKPKIIMIAGVHGSEKAGMYHLYFALKEICERWQSDKRLEALRWGVNFIIVPVANPSGFNLFTRRNGNNVDIARNFTAGWTANADTTAETYPGTAPMTQPENILLDAVMSNNKDAIYFGSYHNFFETGTNPPYFLWNCPAAVFGATLAKPLIINETLEAKKKYNWMPQTNDYYIGYTSLTSPAGSEGKQATEMYGIQASTFECCWKLAWENGQPTYSSAVATLGTEALINWWLLNVKHAIALYNSRVNL